MESPSNTAGIIGGNVTLTCTATGNPRPSIILNSDGNISIPAPSDLILDDNTTIYAVKLDTIKCTS